MHLALLRPRVIQWVLAGVLVTATACSGAQAPASPSPAPAKTEGRGGTLINAIELSNTPNLDGFLAIGEGYGGIRVVQQVFEGLTQWDLSQTAKEPKAVPALAESWTVNDDATVYTFKLRRNVKFHDGTPWNADAAVFNLDRLLNKDAPSYYAPLAGISGFQTAGIKSYRKVDDNTLEITTKRPFAALPEDLVLVFMASPEAVKKAGNEKFGDAPVGTGPFKFKDLVKGQKVEMVANPDYWGGAPKLDAVIFRPIPEASARVAALRSGEINFANVLPPDSIAPLKSAGFQVAMNNYPHTWFYYVNMQEKPWSDKRVRQAANYAIDKETIASKTLLGAAEPAYELVTKGSPFYDPSLKAYAYDPAKAKQLLAEAGYPNGFDTTFMYPNQGSGMMVPGPMNEVVQANLKAVGINVKLTSLDWGAYTGAFFQGMQPNVGGFNFSLSMSPTSYWDLNFSKTGFSPAGLNTGHYTNPRVESMLDQARGEKDDAKRSALYQQVQKVILDDAPWILVVHDLNPKGLSPKVKGFTLPQSWFFDLRNVYVEK